MALNWRILLGFAMIVASYVFRIEVVRFTLGLLRRALPNLVVWIRQFEKMLLKPLSWVVFVLLVWGSLTFMGIGEWLNTVTMDETIGSLGVVFLGITLVWVVVCFCNYLTWAIIKLKGWDGTKSRDDYSRVMIITETIAVIKILLVALVTSGLILGELADMTGFDTSEITLVTVLCLEVIIVLGGHTWLKNVMGGLILLIDEQIKSGLHVRFQGREGVVEQMYLQSFSLRQYDKALVFFPTGILLENSLEIQTKALERRCTIHVHLSHQTSSSQMRLFIQRVDTLLWQKFNSSKAADSSTSGLGEANVSSKERNGNTTHSKTKMSLLKLVQHKQRKAVDFFGVYQTHKLNALDESKNPVGATRFWVSMIEAFMVEVVFYTQERHMKPRLQEKTEVVLSVIQVLEDMNLQLHQEDNTTHPSFQETMSKDDFVRHDVGATVNQAIMHTTSDLESLNDQLGMHRAASDGNVLRLRKRTDVAAI